VYLEDGEMAEVYRDRFEAKTIEDDEVQKEIQEITVALDEISKGDFDHFMLKEIMEQPSICEKLISEAGYCSKKVHPNWAVCRVMKIV
jgi:glucosamine--fructose-6-phosphate aminotransferase (isomerizing)